MRHRCRRRVAKVACWSSGVGNCTGAATRPHNFDDVTPDRYYDTPVAWLAGQFFISGTGPGTYSPNRSITRNETAVLLWLVEGHPTP
ncbi:MAG: S-layer homology domain-containing protein [Candidatus Microthrix sp.]|nr:S-layer homology domain-containing protein [Candidatus Microthrix sp.]